MNTEVKSEMKGVGGVRIAKTPSHLEVRIEELEGEVKEARQALLEERHAAKKAEFEAEKTAKESAWRTNQLTEKIHRLEAERDLGKVSVAQLKSSLHNERQAMEMLIRDHKLEVKGLREDVRSKIHYAYKELQEKDKREMEEVRAARVEAERTYKLLEADFRAVIAEKDEELRRFREEANQAHRELKDELRCAQSRRNQVANQTSESELVRSLKTQIAALRQQAAQLQKQLQCAEDKAVRLANKQRLSFEKLNDEKENEARIEIAHLLQILKYRDISVEQHLREKQKMHFKVKKLKLNINEIIATTQGDVKLMKPQLPAKSAKVLQSQPTDTTLHVKDIVRKLQEKDRKNENPRKLAPLKITNHTQLNGNINSASRVIDDFKAIDADLEVLRRQIIQRDRLIARLRFETKTKDQQLQILSQQKTHQNEDVSMMCSSPDSSTHSNSTSPVLMDNLNNMDIFGKCSPDNSRLHGNEISNDNETDENMNDSCKCGLEEQISLLKEREALLIAEATQLRDQNDLMEFRLLEMEQSRSENGLDCMWPLRNSEDVSDSGVMSLPTSEDLTSDSEHSDPFGQINSVANKLTGVATVFSTSFNPQEQTSKLKSIECLQESGIFEESVLCLKPATENKSCQTDEVEEASRPVLSEELSRLLEIQKRIEWKEDRSCSNLSLADYVGFYEEKISQLEDKLKVYESDESRRDIVFDRRLEKETRLAGELRILKEKMSTLEHRNQVLEEERCEFEEAENDSRLQCQRFEAELRAVLESKSELESQFENLRLLTEASKRKRRKNEGTESHDQINTLKKTIDEEKLVVEHLYRQIDERDETIATLLQLKLTNNSCELINDKSESIAALKERIDTLEKTNQAFIKALSDADQIWATMEEDYKTKLLNLEKKCERLESSEVARISDELACANYRLQHLSDLEISNKALKNQLDVVMSECCGKDEALKAARDQITLVNDELLNIKLANQQKKTDDISKMESILNNLETEVAKLNIELVQKNKEICDFEVTTSELKEEVETLEALVEVGGELVLTPKSDVFQFISNTNKVLWLVDQLFHIFLSFTSQGKKLKLSEIGFERKEKPVNAEKDVKDVRGIGIASERLSAVLNSLAHDFKLQDTPFENLLVENARMRDAHLPCSSYSPTSPCPSPSNSSTLQFALDNLELKRRSESTSSKKPFLTFFEKSQEQISFTSKVFTDFRSIFSYFTPKLPADRTKIQDNTENTYRHPCIYFAPVKLIDMGIAHEKKE